MAGECKLRGMKTRRLFWHRGSLAVLTLLLPFLLTFTAVGVGQVSGAGGGWIGRSLISAVPPSSDDWLFVLEILARGGDRGTEMAADATVCMLADGEVVNVIHQLYHAPGLESVRGRLVRPLSGLQREDAARAAAQIMMDPRYPPDHEICVGAARSVMRVLEGEGVSLLVEKLSQWGDIPDEEDFEEWPGITLAEELSRNRDPDTVPGLLTILRGEEACGRSGGRLGAACALLELGDHVSGPEIAALVAAETNPTIKDCLTEVARRGGEIAPSGMAAGRAGGVE